MEEKDFDQLVALPSYLIECHPMIRIDYSRL
jgi:hypothetical protein